MLKMREETICHFLDILKRRHIECHALSICQNDQLLIEEAFHPYELEKLHPVYSVTKSFTSMAIGFLEAEQRIDIEKPWISYFPEYRNDVEDPAFLQVTIRHLLTMSLGQDCEVEVMRGDHWIQTILGKKLAYAPGSVFFYNSHCSHMLSALVTKLTGEKMSEYLRPRLFAPLQIVDYYWQEDQQGLSIGGYGLHLRIHDLMKFGKCCLDHGTYKGLQVLSESWLKQATSYQMKNVNVYPAQRSENRQGYGLHFWMCTRGGYRMSGLHAQLCFIQPENNLVVAMFNNSTGSQEILDCLFEAMEDQPETAPIPVFKILPLSGTSKETVLDPWLHELIPAGVNDFKLDWIRFESEDDKIQIHISRNQQTYCVLAGYNSWLAQDNQFHNFNTFMSYDSLCNEQPSTVDNTLFASYAWITPTTLKVVIREHDHSAVTTLTFAFDRYYVVLYYHIDGLYTNLTETKCVFKRL